MTIKRRELARALGPSAVGMLCAVLLAASGAAQQPSRASRPGGPDRPNVLLVVTDDQGWGDVGSHGNPLIDTPALDRLAAEGARFERFYVSPVCAPTRASLLTGRYSLRTGTAGVTRGLETMRSEEVTLAELFRDAGYATGMFGKWHNGEHYPHTPGAQGFQEFLGFMAGHWNNYFDTELVHDGRTVKTRGFITDVLTDAAIRYIEANRDRPFLAYVAYNAPHGPFQVPDRYFDKYRTRGLDDRTAAIYGMVESVDDNLDRLLRRLDALGLRDKTIVVFLTDNGPNGARYNGGMRGTKGSVHEGGVRVPLFVRWPGRVPAGRRVERIAAHVDLLPTLRELAGLAAARTLPLDGVSLVPLLTGDPARWPERKIFTHWRSAGSDGALPPYPGAVRTDRYRAVRTGEQWELYDMVDDPGQARDIAGAEPGVTARLALAYEAWLRDVTREPIRRLPVPVGHPAAPVVELPAPEAYPEGGARWYGKHGWANDWLTGFTRPGATGGWEIDVVRAGEYEVELLYAAPRAAVGSRVVVEAGSARLEAQVERAHDPAPLPSPDRDPRIEVHEKEWAVLSAGRLELGRGRSRLHVRVQPASPGSGIELKAVRLRRTD